MRVKVKKSAIFTPGGSAPRPPRPGPLYERTPPVGAGGGVAHPRVPTCLLNNDRLDSYIFTAELRLDGELKASWTGPGVPTRFRDLEATDSFREARLWTMLPDWYGKEVDQLMLAGGSQTGSKFIDWGDRLRDWSSRSRSLSAD